MSCESRGGLGAKPAVWRDKFSLHPHTRLYERTRGGAFWVCAWLFCFCLSCLCVGRFSTLRREKLAQSHRTASPSQVIRLCHARGSIRGDSFVPFSTEPLAAQSKQTWVQSATEQAFREKVSSVEIFIVKSFVSIFLIFLFRPLVRRFTGRRSFFALVGVLVTGSEGEEKHDEHVLCSTSTAA